MSRRTPPPRRPRRKATPLIAGRPGGAPPRAPWILIAVAAAVVAGLVGVAVLASFDEDGARSSAPAGTTDRASFVLVPTGRSRAEVRGLLGSPRRTRTRPADPDGSVCWLYGARSGRPLTYEVCFRGDFLSDKSILPYRP